MLLEYPLFWLPTTGISNNRLFQPSPVILCNFSALFCALSCSCNYCPASDAESGSAKPKFPLQASVYLTVVSLQVHTSDIQKPVEATSPRLCSDARLLNWTLSKLYKIFYPTDCPKEIQRDLRCASPFDCTHGIIEFEWCGLPLSVRESERLPWWMDLYGQEKQQQCTNNWRTERDSS